MKIKRILLLISIVFFVSSCTQRKGDGLQGRDADKSKQGMSVDSDNKEFAQETSEEFDSFIEQFSLKESFQLKRIKFPIKAIVPDASHEGMAPMEETISKYEWEMLDLTYDSTYLTRPYDQYYQVVRFKNDTAIVEIRGIDNGIYADYYFELIDNLWYLVSIYEASF